MTSESEALKDRFGEELVVLLDRAGYFYTRNLWEHVSGKRATETVRDSSVDCVHGDDLDVWYFPPKLPELNPLVGCWDRLKEWFKHRLVPDLPTLKTQIQRGLPTVEEPNIWMVGEELHFVSDIGSSVQPWDGARKLGLEHD